MRLERCTPPAPAPAAPGCSAASISVPKWVCRLASCPPIATWTRSFTARRSRSRWDRRTHTPLRPWRRNSSRKRANLSSTEPIATAKAPPFTRPLTASRTQFHPVLQQSAEMARSASVCIAAAPALTMVVSPHGSRRTPMRIAQIVVASILLSVGRNVLSIRIVPVALDRLPCILKRYLTGTNHHLAACAQVDPFTRAFHSPSHVWSQRLSSERGWLTAEHVGISSVRGHQQNKKSYGG